MIDATAVMNFSDRTGAVYPQTNWNNTTTRNGSIAAIDYLGNPCGAVMTWDGSTNSNFGEALSDADFTTPAGRMFRGSMEIRNDETVRPTVRVTNIPYAEYDVYVYFDMRKISSGTDNRDTIPQKFIITPDSGPVTPPVFGKNSLLPGDALGDYPNYDTWIGFKEATATTASAPNAQMLGNYVVFRAQTSSAFTVIADRGIPTTAQRVGMNGIQIVQATPSVPRLAIKESGGSTLLSEQGVKDTYTAVLTVAPTSDVTVTVNSDSQLTAVPATLIFTPLNWDQPQLVTLTATNDALPEASPHLGLVSHSINASGNYASVTSGTSVSASITDNDQPFLTVTASGTAREAITPTTGRFQIQRSGISDFSLPQTVNFTLSGSATAADYTLTGSGLIYNSATGSGSTVIPANMADVFITVTPTNDSLSEGNETVILSAVGAAAATLGIADDEQIDYFTQIFSVGQLETTFDLSNKKLTLTPDGSASFYSANIQPAASPRPSPRIPSSIPLR